MKKFIVILLAAILLLSMVACGEAGKETEAEPQENSSTPEPQEAEDAEEADGLSFETQDLQGNTWDESAFADYKLTMINFWEPWCGPCVAEMPELQKLSEDYADKGFQLIGVFSTAEGVEAVLEKAGVSYPILYNCPEFNSLQTGYVPNTVFVDSEGNVLGEPYVGARSYDEWAAIIEDLL